jgi:rare lipoprotein A
MKQFILILLVLSLTCGCAHHRRESITPRIKPVEVGWASWYGKDFHGRRTASGAVYDMYQLTAAHQTLPLGTSAMVTHLDNGRSVMVTINDRGPFVKGRIIDLSYAAAQALGMVEEGVAKVRLEVVEKKTVPISPAEGSFTIQVGAFVDRANAVRLVGELQKTHADVAITELKTSQDIYYRVRVGRFKTREEAYKSASRLAQEGYTAFMTRTE